MRQALLPALVACVCLAGCGAAALPTTSSPPIQQAAAAAASGIGVITDAAVSQLYGTTSSGIAWQPLAGAPVHDGPGLADLVIAAAGSAADADDPPTPSIGAATPDPTSYPHPAWTSGSVGWSANITGMPANWYHVYVTFGGTTYRSTDDSGNLVAIDTGGIEVYVHETAGTTDGLGNWTHTVDWYVWLPTAQPVTVTLANGGALTYSLSGLRHVQRAITHTKSTTAGTVTAHRTDLVKIDGDYSALIAALPSLGAVSGPNLDDTHLISRAFDQTTCTGTGTTLGHSLKWNRYATYTIDWTASYPAAGAAGDFPWAGTVSSLSENAYLTVDGTASSAALSDTALAGTYGIKSDMNNAGSAR